MTDYGTFSKHIPIVVVMFFYFNTFNEQRGQASTCKTYKLDCKPLDYLIIIKLKLKHTIKQAFPN